MKSAWKRDLLPKHLIKISFLIEKQVWVNSNFSAKPFLPNFYFADQDSVKLKWLKR